MKIINVVGARPNFMKMAPIIAAMNRFPGEIEHLLVHTGQHYDERMSQAFFDDLGLPKPDIDLEVGSGSHAEQTAEVLVKFERVCLDYKPDLVIVVGDVNSTMACTITAKKLGIKVAHVEAGLRSRDMTMPEEINRLCTDVLCDFLFTTDLGAGDNLRDEGVPDEKIIFVGNVMIDSLLQHKALAEELPLLNELQLNSDEYVVLTLHRPSNVDDKDVLVGILESLNEIGTKLPVVFPMHPRTKKMIESFGLESLLESKDSWSGIRLIEPLGYLEFMHLMMNARAVLTDSGGMQEETTVLGIPCITLRHNTERPITIEQGTNLLVGNKKSDILSAFDDVYEGRVSEGRIPEKWDGKAADRIVEWLIANQ